MKTSRGFLFILFLVSGCFRAPPPAARPREPRLLRWLSSSHSWCPPSAFRRHPTLPSHGCFTHEGLTRVSFDGDAVKVSPALAESLRKDGPRQWLVRLPIDGKWSDGKPLTAQDIVQSWNSVLRQCAQYPDASRFDAIAPEEPGATGCALPRQFAAIDSRTVRVVTQSPDWDLPRTLSHPAFWPTAGERVSGPFLPPVEQGLHWISFANPLSRPPVAEVDALQFPLRPLSPESQVEALTSGEGDLTDPLPAALVAALRKHPLQRTFPHPGAFHLFLGPGAGGTEDRQWLLGAIDREELARFVALGMAGPTGLHLGKRQNLRWEPPPPAPWVGAGAALPEPARPPLPQLEEEGPAPWRLPLDEIRDNLGAQWRRRSATTTGTALGGIVAFLERDVEEDRNLAAAQRILQRLWGRPLPLSADSRWETLAGPQRHLWAPLLEASDVVLQGPRVQQALRSPLGTWDPRSWRVGE